MDGRALAVGDTVTVKGYKTRATVTRVLRAPVGGNNWAGWVELQPALNGYTRWPMEDLEYVANSIRKSFAIKRKNHD